MDTILYYEIRDNTFYYGANQWEGSTALTNTYVLPINASQVLKILPQDDSIVEWYLDRLPETASTSDSMTVATRETDWSHIRLHNYIHAAFHHDSSYSDYLQALTLYNSVNFNKSKQWLNSEFIINDNLDTGTTYNRRGMLAFCSGNIDVSFPGLVNGSYLFAGYGSRLGPLTDVTLDLPNALIVQGRDSSDTTWNLNIPSANTLSDFDNGNIVLNNSVKIHPANCLRNVKSLTGKGNISFIEDDGNYSYAFSNYKGTFDNINIDYNNVVDASYMYQGTNITDIYFDVPKCTNLNYTFSGCSLLKTVKLNTPKVKSMNNTFYNDNRLTTINSSNLSKLTSGTKTFYNCASLVGGNGTSYNSSYSSYTYAKVDREGNPGYFTYIKSDTYYNVEVINSDYASISYPGANFARGDTVEITAKLPSYLGVDYWLQYNTGDNSWHNIGGKNTVSGEIQSDMKLILVPKYVGEGVNFKVSLLSVPSNSCTLAGAGTYKVGDDVVITANPNEGYVFKQWEELINETWIILSYDKEYTLKAIGRDRTIRAVCVEDTSDEVVEITLSLKGGSGSLEGAGKYVKGTKATIKVNVGSRSVFKSWNLPDDPFVVSTQNPYTFTVVKTIEYQAILADNPYGGGGTTEEGGGNGEFNDYIDFTPIPPLNLSATNTDLLSIYTLDQNGVNELAKFIYSDIFDATYQEKLNSILKLFGDVMDQIVSFGIVPFAVAGKASDIMPYLDIHAPVHCKIPYSQYITINCGTKTIGNYWNNFLDYSPYTKYELYLPFIGYKEIDADEIVNKNLSIKYRVDILTGDLVCFITIDEKVRYQFGGNCLISLPLNSSAKDTGSVISGVASLTTAVGGLLLGSGTAAGAGIAGAAVNLITDKQTIKHGSSLSSSSNYLGVLNPVLYITRPRQNVPADYGKIKGYPSNITTQLKNLSGYTVIDEIHLENMSATDDEIEEIETLLKQGVIIN